jgi:hypothetical protein
VLAADAAWQVFWSVAQRPDLHRDVVEALCRSAHESLRKGLALRADLAGYALAQAILVADESPQVRRALAASTQDQRIRERLTADPDPSTRRVAQRR